MSEDSDQLQIFSKPVPQMPDGYYSGDKPNPNLRAFVEAHLKERAYDPETDDYEVQAFDKPIETTKATAIYNMHTYWSKKPHDAIRQYIRHYTKPGDLVLDPLCGSGSTALAALMEGRKAIAIDRSPAATFITKNYCTPVDVSDLRAAFEELKRKVKPEIDWLYETRCDRCGGKATTAYTVYSHVFSCSRCMQKVPLFDCVAVEGKTAKGKPKKVTACPYCHARGIVEEISTRDERFGAVPVQVRYLCQNNCRPKRDDRRYNDTDPRKRTYFEKYDLAKIHEIEAKRIPYWYPPHKMMNVEDDTKPWGDKWRAGTSSFRTVADLFTKRNLWALAVIRNAIGSISDDPVYDALLFAMTGVIFNCSKMYREREEGRGTTKGNYYVPQVARDMVVTNGLYYKIEQQLIPAYQELQSLCTTSISISTQSACNLDAISTNSADYIFTDPAYADKVQYGELNFVWEAWLDFDTHWHDEEIIVNQVRGKTEADWANMIRRAMAECYRVLKPGRWLSLCYHDTSEGTWALMQNIMAEVGFLVDKSDTALFIDTKQKSYNQLTADKVTKRDLVINFQKPKPGEVASALAITGDEDETTFNEKVCAVIRQYLAAHLGATKDRIYDEVVSRMVRAGRMEAHNFEDLLRLVAEEVREPLRKNLFENEDPNLFGTHEISRWYLRETEEGAEESERAVEESTANRIEQFLVQEATRELQKSQFQWDDLKSKEAEKRKALETLQQNDPDRKRPKILREIKDIERQLQELSAKRTEWEAHALHYTQIYEFYLPLQPKPKTTLFELLEDFFFLTDRGNWRPPATESERQEKARLRTQAARRTIQRFCRLLEAGEAIPQGLQPDSVTLAEWIRHCKRSGLYEQGRVLYEKGGLDLDHLPEEVAADVEEDYQVCTRMLARQAEEQHRTRRTRKKR